MNEHSKTVLSYHNRSKHHLQRYAKGPESIDWEDQPDSFRRFSGCKIIKLPKPGSELDVLYSELDTPLAVNSKPLNIDHLGLLFELAFGLSAWKQFGPSRWALRCNPSSGNLHPTEAYIISTGNDFIESGVYHYVSHIHSLERRCRFTDNLPNAHLLIGLSSIHWREAWKYGERAYRYCQHDIGHALGAIRYAAATLGWSIELVAELSDEDLEQLLGLNRDDFKSNEKESPDILLRINTHAHDYSFDHIQTILIAAQTGSWSGKANSLGAYHMYQWSIIEEVSLSAHKPQTQELNWRTEYQTQIKSSCSKTATHIIRQRRSAQQFDGKMFPMPQTNFYRMLAAVLPNTASFELWPWSPKIHLFIFIHRVENLVPGLYALPRDNKALEKLKAATLADFDWQELSELIPLYHLHSGDYKVSD